MGIIETSNLTKKFGDITAVDDVNWSVPEGEITALVGDNGAGKSTLIKMFSGILQPSSGSIRVKGEKVNISDYNEAQEQGIETVYQDLALVPHQSILANVFLGREKYREDFLGRYFRFLDTEYMAEKATDALSRVDIHADPYSRVNDLSGGQRQGVAIARALQSDPDILILDEPTSALSVQGMEHVHDLIRSLNEQGITIIIISHNIDEILKVADRVSVLANGKLMGSRTTEKLEREEVISMMMGSMNLTEGTTGQEQPA